MHSAPAKSLFRSLSRCCLPERARAHLPRTGATTFHHVCCTFCQKKKVSCRAWNIWSKWGSLSTTKTYQQPCSQISFNHEMWQSKLNIRHSSFIQIYLTRSEMSRNSYKNNLMKNVTSNTSKNDNPPSTSENSGMGEQFQEYLSNKSFHPPLL